MQALRAAESVYSEVWIVQDLLQDTRASRRDSWSHQGELVISPLIDAWKGVLTVPTTDPIADMLTRIRNASRVYKDSVDIPYAKAKKAILDLLKAEGFIRNYDTLENDGHRILRVFLKYGANREHVITGITRISKPGLRVYVKGSEVPKVLGGLGVAVISTSRGMMTDRDARQQGIGGEVVCYVW
jgi:small subunit ribosomal protein S8